MNCYAIPLQSYSAIFFDANLRANFYVTSRYACQVLTTFECVELFSETPYVS
jgi:hypothetical protein